MPGSKCTEFQNCPTPGFKLSPHADNILCTDVDCSNTDYEVCCEELAKCQTMDICPTGFHKKEASYWETLGNASLYCADFKCDVTNEADAITCCDQSQTCEFYACGDSVLKANPSTIKCAEKQCSRTDVNTCCEGRGSCSEFDCNSGGPGYVWKDSFKSHKCANGTCGLGDRDTCCDKLNTCEFYACDSSSVHRAGYRTLLCSAKTCTIDDNFVCCEPKKMCNTFTCPTETDPSPKWQKKANSSLLRCQSATCNEAEDTVICCSPLIGGTTTTLGGGTTTTQPAASRDEETEEEEFNAAVHLCKPHALFTVLAMLLGLLKW
jgi:hypothetical protein